MKKFKMIGCCAALAALVGANVWNATTNLKAAELNLSGIENIAEGEDLSTDRKKRTEDDKGFCEGYKWFNIDFEGKYQLPNGEYVYLKGAAGTTKFLHYSYYFTRCKAGEGKCVQQKCK